MNQDQQGPVDGTLEPILTLELSNLLASPTFARSPVQSRLLRYLVEHRLRGDQPVPKAYEIATKALGRPADFDASVDSYPRVMVGRLRALLDRYYAERAWMHRLRIPQGSYDVVVQYRAAPPTRSGEAERLADRDVQAEDKAADPMAYAYAAAAVAAAEAGGGAGGGLAQPQRATQAGGFEALTALLSPATRPEFSQGPNTRFRKIWQWLDQNLPQPDVLKRWARMAWAVCLAALVGGAAALLAHWYGVNSQGGARSHRSAQSTSIIAMPRIAVQVTEANETNAGTSGHASALSGHLQDAFENFEMVSLASRRGAEGADGRVTVAGKGLSSSQVMADYLIDALLTHGGDGNGDGQGQGEDGVTVVVHRLSDRRSIWSEQVRLNMHGASDFRALDPIISQIAGDYGVIVRDQAGSAPDDYRIGFPCLAQFQRLRITGQSDGMREISDCLKATQKQAPRSPLPLAALSYMALQDALQVTSQAEQKAFKEQAFGLAQKAYDADPNSPRAIFVQSLAHFYSDDCGPALVLARRAEAKNPLDADMLGQLSLTHQFCGSAQDVQRLQARSLALDSSFPALPLVGGAFALVQQGKPQEALDRLEGLTNFRGIEVHYRVVKAMALAQLDRQSAAEAQWKRLIALAGLDENASAEEVLRRFVIADMIVRSEAAGLRDAGVAPRRTAD